MNLRPVLVAFILLHSVYMIANATGQIRRAQMQDIVDELNEKVNKLVHLTLKGADWYLASNNFWYKIFQSSANYSEAKAECHDRGARLVSLGMRDAAVRSEIIQHLVEPVPYYVWIGLDDVDNHFYWVWSDGAPSTSANTNWVQGEPNNHGAAGEHCAAIDYRSSRRWGFNDDNCANAFYYICEIEI